MLRKRIITALGGILLVGAAIWFDGPIPWFTVFTAVWGLLAIIEFYKIVTVSKVLPLTLFGIIWTLLFIVHPHFNYEFIIPVLLTSAVVFSLILLLLYPEQEGIFNNWAWAIAGIFYVGLLLSYLVALRLDAGRNWVFLALLVTFGSDSAAFFFGRALGRHHMAPRISPAKTWEGAAAGLIGAIIISLLFTLPTPLQLPLSYGQAILLGILVSIFGQLGDLVESLLKRSTGIKESGKLIPGHGGLLDRMDSVVFAGAVVYFFYIFAII
ncbi:phosphatidate cytidylyltransferase [Chloroflexota bacterium]